MVTRFENWTYEQLPRPKKCPNGRRDYSSPPTQLRMIQDMISQAKISVNCQNGFRGCPVAMKSEELDEHEKECQFRLVLCPEGDCQEMIVFAQVESHYMLSEGHDFEEQDTRL